MNANDHTPGVNITPFGTCAMIEGACTLATPFPWIYCNLDVLIEGAPILTNDSKLACACGGVISLVLGASAIIGNNERT